VSNLEFWDSVSKTDPTHTKKAKIGTMNITAIDPQYQRKNATAAFGMYGSKWGIVAGSETYTIIEVGENEKLCLYMGTFFYYTSSGDVERRGEFPISSTNKVQYMTRGTNPYMKVIDEFAKIAQTDALTKGLSFLGFNSDVFEGKFDGNKYVAERKEEVAKEKFMADVTASIPADDIELYKGYVTAGDGLALVAFMGAFPKDDPKREAFFASWPTGTKTAMGKKHGATITQGMKEINVLVEQLNSYIATEDEQGIVEVWDDCAKLKKFMMPHLTKGTTQFLTERAAKKKESNEEVKAAFEAAKSKNLKNLKVDL